MEQRYEQTAPDRTDCSVPGSDSGLLTLSTVDRAKPVFNAEYAPATVADPTGVCAASADAGVRTLILPLDLDDSFRISCDD